MNSPKPLDKDDIKRLREAISDPNEYSHDDHDSNYECVVCGWHTYIDDHQRRTPNWCEGCKEISTFEEL